MVLYETIRWFYIKPFDGSNEIIRGAGTRGVVGKARSSIVIEEMTWCGSGLDTWPEAWRTAYCIIMTRW